MAAHQTQAALPSGGIAMAAITPFAGLFKWCILAPLTTPPAEYEHVEDLYSKLYLGLLKNLLEVMIAHLLLSISLLLHKVHLNFFTHFKILFLLNSNIISPYYNG